MDDRRSHWEKIYSTKTPDDLSWTQASPSPSIDWIKSALTDRSSSIIDIGGGNSRLVDALLKEGYARPAILDLSSAALKQSRDRLGDADSKVEWIEGDVTQFRPTRKFALWHDRAVFHFLTKREDRERYCQVLRSALEPRGQVLLATFSPTGPVQCSGLNVMHFDEAGLENELGSGFVLQRSEEMRHVTPWGSSQDFLYCLFKSRV